MLCSRFTALTVLLLLTATTANPLAQYGHVLDSTVDQLSTLGAAGYSTQSFATLSALLSNLFGSMMSLSEPYFHEFIRSMLAQNAAYIAQIQQLEDMNAAANALFYNELNSISGTLGSLVAAIGSQLFNYQNDLNAQLYRIGLLNTANRNTYDLLNARIPVLRAVATSNENLIAAALPRIANLQALFAAAVAPNGAVYDISNPAPSFQDPTRLHCFARSFDVTSVQTGTQLNFAAVAHYRVAPGDTTTPVALDTHILSASSTTIVVDVCRQDLQPILPSANDIVVQLVVA